jgi:hypothetical protein
MNVIAPVKEPAPATSILDKESALKLYKQRLTGKTVNDLKHDRELATFVANLKKTYGFHLHIKKDGKTLDPCDGAHGHAHKPAEKSAKKVDHSHDVRSLHNEPTKNLNPEPSTKASHTLSANTDENTASTSETKSHSSRHQHEHNHYILEHQHSAHDPDKDVKQLHSHDKHQHHHNHDETHSDDSQHHAHSGHEHHPKTKSGLLGKVIDALSKNDNIPKSLKPLLVRATINLSNIFLAQGVSAPLHGAHAPQELISSAAVGAMHGLNHGAGKWQDLARNMLTVVPFVALHRVVKVPNYVMRSVLGLAVSLSEQLGGGSAADKPLLEKIKDTFTKDAAKFAKKVLQMETMLNTAIPLGKGVAKSVKNKPLAFILQNTVMAGAFTVIPQALKSIEGLIDPNKKTDKDDTDTTALTAELLECPVCGEAHGADVHLAEISEGVSAAGAANASSHHNLHHILHPHHDHGVAV